MHPHTHTHSTLLTLPQFPSLDMLGRGWFGISVCICECVFICVHACTFAHLCVRVCVCVTPRESKGAVRTNHLSPPLLGFLCLSVSAQMKICSTRITRVPSHRFLGNSSCLKPLAAVLFIVRMCQRVFVFVCVFWGCHFCRKGICRYVKLPVYETLWDLRICVCTSTNRKYAYV